MPIRMTVPERKGGRLPENPKLVAPEDPALTPKTVYVPDEPVYGDDEPGLRDEQQVARTEILMAKGVRDRRQLMALLNVGDYRTMDRYIKRVYARWEMLGANRDFARHRGEGLARLDMLESELWSRVSNTGDDRVALVALKTITDVQKQRMDLLGLTPKVVERLTTQGNDNIPFTKRLATHDMMARVASRMLSLVEERTGPRRGADTVIEGNVETIDAA